MQGLTAYTHQCWMSQTLSWVAKVVESKVVDFLLKSKALFLTSQRAPRKPHLLCQWVSHLLLTTSSQSIMYSVPTQSNVVSEFGMHCLREQKVFFFGEHWFYKRTILFLCFSPPFVNEQEMLSWNACRFSGKRY